MRNRHYHKIANHDEGEYNKILHSLWNQFRNKCQLSLTMVSTDQTHHWKQICPLGAHLPSSFLSQFHLDTKRLINSDRYQINQSALILFNHMTITITVDWPDYHSTFHRGSSDSSYLPSLPLRCYTYPPDTGSLYLRQSLRHSNILLGMGS